MRSNEMAVNVLDEMLFNLDFPEFVDPGHR